MKNSTTLLHRCIIIFLLILTNSIALAQSFEQTRALWVTRWDYKSTSDIEKIIDNAVLLNFNVILFQVRGAASAMYNSSIEPRSELLDETNPDWDPLDSAIAIAHQAGMQLHAWINLYPGWSGDNPPRDQTHVYYKHPGWFMYDVYGRGSKLKNGYQWLAPTHPEVTPYLIDVCKELYENYAIDGLHLDYIRYPAATYSYDATSVRLFTQKFGATPEQRPTAWRRWRQNSISELLDALARDAKKSKPDLIISAAAISNYDLGKKIYFQDSHSWLARGSVDAVYPMLYTNDTKVFARKLKEFVENNHSRHIYAGISLEYDDLEGKFEAIKEVGAHGVGIFSYKEITQNHTINQDYLTLLSAAWSKKTQPTAMPWKAAVKDNQGPLITQVQSVPSPLPPNTPFKIAARIEDESGLVEKDSRRGGPGIFVATKSGDKVQMKRIDKTRHWFISDESFPGQDIGSVVQAQITALDNAFTSANNPRRNVGYSEQVKIPLVKPDSSFQYIREIGPILWRPGDLAIDDLDHIWVTTEKEGPVIIMDSTGALLDFSPLKTGLDGYYESKWLDGIVGFAKGPFNTMLVACNAEPPTIFRFDIHTGEPLPGIELSFNVGAIATNDDGYIYALEKNTSQWYVLSQTGVEVNGSPYGSRSNSGDIAALKNGAAVFVSDWSNNVVQNWHGAVEGVHSTYWAMDNVQEFELGSGNLFVDDKDQLFVCNSRFSHIAVYNRAGAPIGHIIDKKNLVAPLSACASKSGNLFYHIEVVGNGPTKVRQWVKRK